MRGVLIFLWITLAPALAEAGAWAREKGSFFASTTATAVADPDDVSNTLKTYGSLYAEYGLGRQLTAGVDTGMEETTDYSAMFFLRKSFTLGADTNQFAVLGGLGVGSTGAGVGGSSQWLTQIGFSYGRGFETRFGGGWLAFDTSATYRTGSQDVAGKADLTLGLKPTERTKLMLQLQAGQYPGSDPYLRVVPSIARKFGERVHIELGAQIGVVGDERVGLKLGTWMEF
jgi:hypothetical protein